MTVEPVVQDQRDWPAIYQQIDQRFGLYCAKFIEEHKTNYAAILDEIENLESGLIQLNQSGQLLAYYRSLQKIFDYLFLSGDVRLAQELIELGGIARLKNEPAEVGVRFYVLQGQFYERRAEYDKGIAAFLKALKLLEKNENFELRFLAHANLLSCYTQASQFAEAEALIQSIEEELLGRREEPDRLTRYRYFVGWARYALETGQTDKSIELHHLLLDLADQIGRRDFECGVRLSLGSNLGIKGYFADALIYLQEGLKIAEEEAYLFYEAQAYHTIGALDFNQGRFDEAEVNMRKAIQLAEDVGHVLVARRSEMNLGTVLLNIGRYEEAKELILSALTHFETVKTTDLIISLETLGLIAFKQDNIEMARDYLHRSFAHAQALQAPIYEAAVLMDLALVEIDQETWAAGLDYAEKGFELAIQHEAQDLIGQGYYRRAVCHFGLGDSEAANELSKQGLEILISIGHYEAEMVAQWRETHLD